jgi:hypothetical protein
MTGRYSVADDELRRAIVGSALCQVIGVMVTYPQLEQRAGISSSPPCTRAGVRRPRLSWFKPGLAQSVALGRLAEPSNFIPSCASVVPRVSTLSSRIVRA